MPNTDQMRLEKDDEGFQEVFLRDFPRFRERLGDVRALRAFRREFKLANYENMDIFVLVHEGDVSADRVFEEEGTVVYFTNKSGEKRALEARGHQAKKTDMERQGSSERADVVIMLDPSIRTTKNLLARVKPNGWVLCRLDTANSLRARGSYSFRAMIEKSDDAATLSRREKEDFWQSLEVDSDKSFQKASAVEHEGVATYEEAKKTLKDVGMSHDNVFENYSSLIKRAKEQNPQAVARGETLLTCRVEVDGQEKEITVNTALPTKEGDYDDAIIVMKKNPI